MKHFVSRSVVAVVLSAALLAPAARAANPADQECARGISLALRGEFSRASEVFRAMLNHSPRDARALNNLGNLYLLRGQPRMALGSYRLAMREDAQDPGIRLNEASAYYFLGQDTAQMLMRAAIRKAGGLDNASRLLGVHAPPADGLAPRAAERPRASREEIQELLVRAAGTVPAQASRADSARKPAPRKPESGRVSVPGGTRAADAGAAGDSSAVESALYWKR